MSEYTGMTPTVIVGVGGTGKEILIKIRRMIVEQYGSLDALPIVSFLHIDTEQNAKVSEPQVVLKQDISLRPVEQVWAGVSNAKGILGDLSSYPFLEEWFPDQLKHGTDRITEGAGQIRALGKLAFSLNYQEIKKSFNAAKAGIIGKETLMLDKRRVQLDKGINIFVVCSLSGGTGSGMVMDLAYNIRDWIPSSEMPQSSAYFVLPGAFSGLGDRVIANAYSALMELNHYSQDDTCFESQYSGNQSERISTKSGQDVPFNFCYLVGNSNDKVAFSRLTDVLEMVAQNIFLDFSSGFSQYKKLVRDNVRKQWASPDEMGYPQNFMSFGLSSIQFPIDRVLNACSSRLAGRLVNWWSNPTPTPFAMKDVIKTEILPSLFLAESEHDHQLLDSISMSDNMKPLSKEVAEWVAEVRKRRNDLNIPFENLQRFISNEQAKYAPRFSDRDYFQRMSDNLNRLIPQKRQELRQTVYKMVEDRFRGPKFTRQFLETLLEVFNEYRSRFDQDRQKNWLPKEKTAQNALQVLLKQIDDRAKQFLLVNRKNVIEEDFRGIMQALESIYTSKVEVKSRTLGNLLLDALREEIEQLLIDLAAFDAVLETLQTQLKDKEQTYQGETSVMTVNGILLYDPEDINRVYRSTIEAKEEVICQMLSQQILEDEGVKNLFDFYTFDTLRMQGLAEKLLNRSMEEFRKGVQFNTSTARKFLEQYPTVEQQEAQIKTTFEKSEPFLRLSQEQKKMGWEDKPEKYQKLVGIQGGNQSPDPAVASHILPIVRKTSTVTDKDIHPLDDPHHIYFVQEIGAFPLRLIEGMEKMRSIYRSVAQSDKNPLHTHQDSRRFKDLMPESGNETQIRHNLVLAKALDLVKLEENRVSRFDEVKFFYQDKQTGLNKVQVLGENWQEAEEFLLADRNSKIAGFLDEAIRAIGQAATTKPEKQTLYQMLMFYLHQQETTVSGGKDSPVYQKVEKAIAEYVKVHSLFISSAVNGAVSKVVIPIHTETKAAQANASSENVEKFTKLVETCYSKGNPTSTELQLLEKFRQKYGISEAEAKQIADQCVPKQIPQQAIEEFEMMFRAFLENDGDIDFQEQAHLLELQEELGLTNEQVASIEASVRKELVIQ